MRRRRWRSVDYSPPGLYGEAPLLAGDRVSWGDGSYLVVRTSPAGITVQAIEKVERVITAKDGTERTLRSKARPYTISHGTPFTSVERTMT